MVAGTKEWASPKNGEIRYYFQTGYLKKGSAYICDTKNVNAKYTYLIKVDGLTMYCMTEKTYNGSLKNELIQKYGSDVELM
jgi:hypothetical protein